MSLSLADRIVEHIPRAALLQLVSLAEELKRRAKSGQRLPETIPLQLVIEPQTGTIDEVEIPRRYGWS